MTKHKYQLPPFLIGRCSANQYRKWLTRRAQAHVLRDRSRGNRSATRAVYMAAINQAVLRSHGRDAYTGQRLEWARISTYDNAASKKKGRQYKQAFGDLPSVDHEGDGRGAPKFRICSWRVNDAKNDLPYPDFVRLCSTVLGWHRRGRRLRD